MNKPPVKEPAFRDKQEPAFRNPPQWIHESVAGKFFAPLASRRDARRRAILELLERLPRPPAQARRAPRR